MPETFRLHNEMDAPEKPDAMNSVEFLLNDLLAAKVWICSQSDSYY